MNAASAADAVRFAGLRIIHPWTAMLLAALFYAGFNAYWWNDAWDDMAITLGFARTVADAGIVAPTPLSDPVEGISSLLWMILNAGLYKLHGSPGLLYGQAKLLGIAFLLLDVGLVFVAAIACGVSRPVAFIVALTFAGSHAAIIESINGMENPLYVFLLLVAFLSYFKIESKRYFAIFLISTSATLFARWSAPWFLLPFALIHWRRHGLRGLIAVQHWIWLGLFAAQTVWRLLAFGDFLPNTIRAKMQPPYSPPAPDETGDFILRHISYLLRETGIVKPFLVLAAGVVAAAVVLWFLRRARAVPLERSLPDAIPTPVLLAIAIVAAGAIFAAVTGGNWGHRGRMFFVALPFLLITVAWGVERVVAMMRVPAHLAVLVVLTTGALTVAYGIRGAHRHLSLNKVTVAELGRILPALETAKRLTGLTQLTVAHPDLGAPILFGDGFRIVDTALLCNRSLAKEGYEAFEEEIFGRERPDIIQTHGVWTKVSDIAEAESLYADYDPIFLHGIRLFMRRSVLARIPDGQLERRPFAADGGTRDYGRDLLWTMHSNMTDFAINRRFGYYWVAAGDQPQPAN